MSFKKAVGLSTLAALLMTLSFGCGQGTDVQLAPAPAIKAEESKPLPKETKKGGGPASSGNAGRNPGGNT